MLKLIYIAHPFGCEQENVADAAWNVVETKGLSDVLLNELAGRLADWETWKEGER